MSLHERRLFTALRGSMLIVVASLLTGCEQLKEEYVFWNETPEPIRIGTGCLAVADEKNTSVIEPGTALRDAHRPVSLPGEPLFGFNHEDQFRHNYPTGITLVNSSGKKRCLDTKALRSEMDLSDVRVFTIHIRPAFFKVAP